MRCCSTFGAWEGDASGLNLKIRLQPKATYAKSEVKAYLDRDQLGLRLTQLLARLLKEEPDDPIKYLIEKLHHQKNNTRYSALKSHSTASKESGFSHNNSAHVLDLPLVVSQTGQAKIIDLGPGRCTFFACALSREQLQIQTKARDISFFESFVDGWRVESFSDAIVDSFGLKALPKEAQKVVPTLEDMQTIFVGNTDPNTRNSHHERRAEDFLAASEHTLLTRGFPILLRMFAPSQLLIFKLELFASQWLASHSSILNMMPKNVTFSGILSSHPFSSNMAMAAGGNIPSMQLWTLPLGAMLPIAEGLFSSPEVQDHEVLIWRSRIREELAKANFAVGISGLWVGISGIYDTMAEVGCTDVVLSKAVTLARIATAIEKCPMSNGRNLSSLVFVQEMLRITFDEHSWFLFKRKWRVDSCKEELETCWPLGLYHQQMALKKHETATHQAVTGKNMKPGHSRLLSPWNMPAGAFFEVPYIAWPTGAAMILDFGTSETGVYKFEPDILKGQLQLVHEVKLSNPLYECVVKGSVSELAESIIKELKLADLVHIHRWRRVLLVGGATGQHRSMITEKSDVRERIIMFLRELEESMRQTLGVPVCFRLFVPSGEYEAELELRSVQWLMSQTDLGMGKALTPQMYEKTFAWMSRNMAIQTARRPSAASMRSTMSDPMKIVTKHTAQAQLRAMGVPPSVTLLLDSTALKDPFTVEDLQAAAESDRLLQPLIRSCSFSGTISAGGGSCQLTLGSGSSKNLAQLYSMPIGNRSPSTGGLFPAKGEITEEKRMEWTQQVKGMVGSSFPAKLSGFFVGISAAFHAAKAAGIADRFVSQREAIAGLNTKIQGLDPTDSRSISNLILVREIIDGVFDEESSFLFKRNWTVGESTYVAGWTLGLYSTQFESDSDLRHTAARHLQRCVRGWLVRKMIL
mmetsp:Transcript_7912/g.18529  ORF Transcript_7912/g.18529 Transcript_7912/m.18529 type:complete len:921 (-) Transcript_7912:12-2774(-)